MCSSDLKTGVHLVEALKQLAEGDFVHANPGVFDAKQQARLRLLIRAVGETQADRALVGELDGVVKQVEQNLTQPGAIGFDPGFMGRQRLEHKGQFFFAWPRAA